MREAYQDSVLRRLGLGEIMGDLFRRPRLLVEATRTYFAMRRRGRPTPSRAYLRWRSFTAYGEHAAAFESEDVIDFLEWRRRHRRGRARKRRTS